MHYRNPLQRIINASRYSLAGLLYAFRNEQAFRYEAVILIIMCLILPLLSLPLLWSVCLAGAWVIVMCFELVNSAVEKAFDLITCEYSPLVKAGKDMISASIFLVICVNVILWCVAIISHLV